MKKTCSCIVPFYNEEKRILGVLSSLLESKYIDEIIVVNDGSTDQGKIVVVDFIQNKKKISFVDSKVNKGKSHAVSLWLKQAKGEYVFLCDADLSHIKVDEIDTMISSLYERTEIDMGILRRIYAKWYIKLLYRELILSGSRMLRRSDLTKIFQHTFSDYQLEVAINDYMRKYKKQVMWYPFSANNIFKSKKLWRKKGIKKDFLMYKNIINYAGLLNFLRQTIFFRPKKIQKQYFKQSI